MYFFFFLFFCLFCFQLLFCVVLSQPLFDLISTTFVPVCDRDSFSAFVTSNNSVVLFMFVWFNIRNCVLMKYNLTA